MNISPITSKYNGKAIPIVVSEKVNDLIADNNLKNNRNQQATAFFPISFFLKKWLFVTGELKTYMEKYSQNLYENHPPLKAIFLLKKQAKELARGQRTLRVHIPDANKMDADFLDLYMDINLPYKKPNE